jgi:hypothetical protein
LFSTADRALRKRPTSSCTRASLQSVSSAKADRALRKRPTSRHGSTRALLQSFDQGKERPDRGAGRPREGWANEVSTTSNLLARCPGNKGRSQTELIAAKKTSSHLCKFIPTVRRQRGAVQSHSDCHTEAVNFPVSCRANHFLAMCANWDNTRTCEPADRLWRRSSFRRRLSDASRSPRTSPSNQLKALST